MSRPKKNQGWSQGLYAVSSTKKETIGALRETEDGRKYRYAKAGATTVCGGSTYSPATDANFIAQIQTSGAVNAIGSTRVAVYVGGTAVTANMFDDGYLVLYRTAGVKLPGRYYPISSHSVSAAGSEIIYLQLKEPLQEATLLTDYFSIYQNPWSGISNVTDIAVTFTGIAQAVATSGQFLWLQTGGFCAVMGGDTSAIGMVVCPSDTTYCMETAAGYTGPFAGYVFGGALVSGYFTPVILTVD
jgi:hypothetical protein